MDSAKLPGSVLGRAAHLHRALLARGVLTHAEAGVPLGCLQGRAGQLLRHAAVCRQPWGRPSLPPSSQRGVPGGSSNGLDGLDLAPCTPSHTAHTPAGEGHTAQSPYGFLQAHSRASYGSLLTLEPLHWSAGAQNKGHASVAAAMTTLR